MTARKAAGDPLRLKLYVGVFWDDAEKVGYNPVTKQEIKAIRRALNVNYELPLGEEYANYVISFLRQE